MKLEGRDIVAIVSLLGGFTLMGLGIDHLVGAVISAITAYYFGIRIIQIHRGGKR